MQKKRSSTSHPITRLERLKISNRLLALLVSIFLLTCIICVKESRSQSLTISPPPSRDNLDYEILELSRQLDNVVSKLNPIETELGALKENNERITSEITSLKQQLRNSRGFWDRITGIFSERKLKKLLAESQYISERITELQKSREPLVREFVIIADKLMGRAEARIIALMDIIIKGESEADKASQQISTTLQLTRKVKILADKYTSDSLSKVKSAPLLSLTNDPEKLRLGARFSKNMAIQYRAEAEKKKRETKDLQASQRNNEMIIEKWREIQRSNEERESSGVESVTANIPSGFNESEFRRTIEEIKRKIDRLSSEVRELEEEARNMDNQSKMLEQRASQIEATPKGK